MRFLKFSILWLFMAVPFAAVSAQTSYKPGDRVFAWWEQTESYYVGTVVEVDNTIKGGGYMILFYDGAKAVVPIARIKTFKVKVGDDVWGLWSDNEYFPGKIQKIVGDAYFIQFNDGDSGWVSIGGISNR